MKEGKWPMVWFSLVSVLSSWNFVDSYTQQAISELVIFLYLSGWFNKAYLLPGKPQGGALR